jgi:hypothetical protein
MLLMGGYLWGIGLALLAAVGVIVMANAVGDGGTDLRSFWRDLRNGLRRRDDAEAQPDEDDAEPVDVPFEQLFAEASQPDDGYLQLDELAEMLERTGDALPRPRLPVRRPHVRSPHVPGAARAAARRSGHVPTTTVPRPPQPRDG